METTSELVISTYSIDVDKHDRSAVRASCQALIDVLAPILGSGFIDGISDFPIEEVDEAGIAALELLSARAEIPSKGRLFRDASNLAGIDLDLSKDEDVQILRDFGPWTIHTEIYSDSRVASQGISVLCFHDSGWDLTGELTDEEAALVASLLPTEATIKKLEPRQRRWSGWLSKKDPAYDR